MTDPKPISPVKPAEVKPAESGSAFRGVAIALSAAILVFLLSSCGWCDTPECFDAKSKYEAQRAESARLDAQARNEREIAAMKAQAEIEASKPESVRLQEAKNQETTTGEWIETAAQIGAGVYLGAKVLDVLTR